MLKPLLISEEKLSSRGCVLACISVHAVQSKTEDCRLATKTTIMDACNAVEEEVDKILLKFTGIKEHADRVLSDVTNHIESLKKEMDECKLLDFPDTGEVIHDLS